MKTTRIDLQREMVIHREKYTNHHFKLSIKTEHSALSSDSSTPTVTLSATVDLQQHGLHSDSQERVTKGDGARLGAEPATERLTGQAELQQQMDQSAAGVDARPDDSSSSSTSPLTRAPFGTQTERHSTAYTNDALDEILTSAPPESQIDGHNPRIVDDDSKQLVAKGNVDLEMEKLKKRTEKRQSIYQVTDTIIAALDHLAEMHELARIAFIVVSKIYDVIKAKHEQNEAIIALHGVMVATYKIAVEKDALNDQGDFSGLFDEIVRQSEECYVFLSNYILKGCLSQVMDLWKTSSKIEDFNCAFEELQKRFFNTQNEVTTVTVLYTQRVVESIDRKMSLRPLEPSAELLGPKCHCLLGTRRSSLTKILDWCFYGEQSTLWISGIAGCGKSSLIGTLHNSLSMLGFHSRLAAFIRFDRSSYRNAKEFVKALAFLLANFDERFGKRIVEVVEKSPQIAQITDLSTQVQKLLINPLRGLTEEVAKEGRIVVLVDGIDECSREDQAETRFREQLLELFAKNAFGLLSFLRFVLASRPEEDIIRFLQHCSHIHHFPLDHTSPETTNDIHYFLNKSFERSCFINLTNARKQTAVERLAERASGLFVWAATVVTFIGENMEQRLKVFVEQEPPKNALHALTALYEIALKSLVREGDEDIQQNIYMALGLIMATSAQFKQFPIHVLHDLLQYVDPDKAPGILSAFNKLRSLVIKENEKYQLLHKSFDDFLTCKDRAGHWYINMEKYEAILYEAIITCTMDHLDKADKELPEALSSDLYQYAIDGPYWGVVQDLSLYQSLQQKLKRFLLGYVAEELQHDSEFMQKAWLGASRLQHINTRLLVVKDFFNIMLYDTALAGKATKTNADDQHALEWEVDNIYMSVFVQMAGGSNVYEEIVAVLDKKPIPPVVSLSVEIEMLIKIVSGGKIRMKTGSVDKGKERSTKEFIEWGKYKRGVWVPIMEPKDYEDSEDSEDSDW
ncbi:hypothetical protein VNI00_008880 [Paramarasmius palmivorus]|uniref:NACHT domain-containing protein n=1 Tax=Paramarasmius palmivorus TaxID=297713 RepID=A0AAW0CT08_9AGAR